MLISPNTVTVDLTSIEYNSDQIRNYIEKDTKIMGIVKSDAYGHGLVPVSRTLEKKGIYCLGVSFLEEGIKLRESGIRIPIVILCGIATAEHAEAIINNTLTPVIYDPDSARILDRAAERKGKKVNVHVKIDTGMGRLGVGINETVEFLKKIDQLENLKTEALMSHMSSADEADDSFSKSQIMHFKTAVDEGRRIGMDLKFNHLANSAGIISYRDSYFDMVRPGIMLYGGLPSPDFVSPLKLRQVMALKARILQVHDFPDNTPVSYGRTYYTRGERRIAIVSAGYADGMLRSMSNRGKVLVGGRKTDITGTICMNMFACDITGMEKTHAGDECVIMGSQGNDGITVDDIAGWCGTISYEVLLSIGRGSERHYIQ